MVSHQNDRLFALIGQRTVLRTEIAAVDIRAGSKALKDIERNQLEDILRGVEDNIVELLDSSSTIPRTHLSLKPDVDRMTAEVPFEQSVFFMTSFAVGKDPVKDRQLKRISDAIEKSLDAYGLRLRRADRRDYSASKQLWDNVQIHMLGCRYGIALLESHYRDELNPNVALEYGFMKALGRDLVLLIEKEFKHRRADILSTLGKQFEWTDDARAMRKSIQAAIHSWMADLGRPRMR